MRKLKKKLKAPIFTAIWTAGFVLLLAFAIVASSVTGYYDAVIRDFMGVLGANRVREVDDGLDKNYNTMDFDTIQELDDYERALVRVMGGEGYVLLKNDTTNGLGLPLTTEPLNKSKVSLFSHSSVDLVAGGTGSGTGSSDVSLKDAFEAQDFKVNEKLWNFYSSGAGSSYVRGVGSVNYGHGDEVWNINECPLSVMKAEHGLLDSAKDSTAIYVLARTGGEGRDLARDMSRYTSIEEDKHKHYLEPDSVELEILSYLNDNFNNVILVVNTNNVMELGWVENYANIKSVLWAPGGGGETANSIVDVLSGKVTPSGHLVDTIAYDAFSAPAMQNFGDFQYVMNGKPVTSNGKDYTDPSNTNSQNNGFYGVSYDEGIYIGYKYYETRYFDKVAGQGNAGDYNYDTTVQYPFGYGLSYTEFDWSNFQLSAVKDGKMTASVKVANVGNYVGKEVVGIYVNAPYTDYDKANHIEKSAVSLIGYAKTESLRPQESQVVEIEIDTEYLRTYDDVGERTYILEGGDYVFTAGSDAHDAVNNVLHKMGMTDRGDAGMTAVWNFQPTGGANYEIFDRSKSGDKVTNHFDDANYIARDQYLTRQDWVGSWPVVHGSQAAKVQSVYSERNGYVFYEEISNELYQKLLAKGTAEAANSPIKDSDIVSKAGTYGVKGDLELIDYRGLDFDQADWNAIVSQMASMDVQRILNLSGYTTLESEAIVKPATSDLDGPMGLNLMATHEPFSIAYPAEVTIAASWNVELSERHGDAIAQDGLRDNVLAAGWYGPGANIHRTPFSGRNFEYYSEDSFMSGTMAEGAIRAAAEKGMYSFIKHFALNDQEDHRDQNGISSWCNEQAMREIYLRPFQMVFEAGTVETKYYEGTQLKVAQTPIAMAVMTSFNRIGATWAGGDYRLITQVLREEWNFNGLSVTDYSNGAETYMHTEQMLRAGADVQLSQYGVPFSNMTEANIYYSKQAMAHVLYTVANSNTMNGFTHGARLGYAGFPNYYFILYGVYALTAGVGIAGAVLCTKRFLAEKRAKNTH